MPLNIDTALGIHPQALAVRARRAELLAANLANSDTPNYKARDIDFRALLGAAQTADGESRVTLAATHGAHLQAGGAGSADGELMDRVPTQPSIDGNTVDPQAEYAAFAQNAIQYQASLTFLSSRIKTLLTAIRGD
jgi:flagellar basal-body rod protein FlgB